MSDCFRRFFSPVNPNPPVIPRIGCGFPWRPNTPIANFNVVELHDNDPGDLYIGFDNTIIGSSGSCFEDPHYGLGIIIQPLTVSPPFEQSLAQITGIVDQNILQRFQGFLKYTNDCLNYINATPQGQNLLNALQHTDSKTFVIPSPALNCYTPKRNSLCLVADTIIHNLFNVPANQNALDQALIAASGRHDDTRFDWLAQQVNLMPLYSAFVGVGAYQDQFLTNQHHPVTGHNLQDWFQNGNNCDFINTFNQLAKVEGVSLFNFLQLAVITTLYSQSPAGVGGDTTVYFDVKDYVHNTLDIDDLNAVRPPAVGLAHELVHAYYVSQGKQPGDIFGSWSTTLTELICVGLGPFAANPISENLIRAAWPPHNVPAVDLLNNRLIAQRDPYEPVPLGKTVEAIRNEYGCI